MSAHDDSDEERTALDSDVLREQRRRYQWYVGYSRSDEYNKNPPWTDDTDTETITQCNDGEDDEDCETVVKLFDRYDSDNIWLTSTKQYNLTRMR